MQVGHVDAGKSTLMGRILHLLGRVTQKEMHKNEKESKQQVHNPTKFTLCTLIRNLHDWNMNLRHLTSGCNQ